MQTAQCHKGKQLTTDKLNIVNKCFATEGLVNINKFISQKGINSIILFCTFQQIKTRAEQIQEKVTEV